MGWGLSYAAHTLAMTITVRASTTRLTKSVSLRVDRTCAAAAAAASAASAVADARYLAFRLHAICGRRVGGTYIPTW
jgi:hypothetical protein